MAATTKISWADSVFNPWIGCSRVSPGCQNCYAENLMDKRYHRAKWGHGQPRVRNKTWGDPIKWNREAERAGVRKKVFCASLADWLDEEVPEQWRQDLLGLIEVSRNLDWLMLTKRPENATKMLPLDWLIHPRPHVWFGVSVENQQYWERRVSLLMEIPAAIRWVSYEPALGPLASLEHMRIPGNYPDWLVIGGESSQDFPARSFDIAWAEGAIALCREHGVAPFMKQIGSNAYHGLLPFRTKDRAGADPAEWPESIRVREFPLAFPHAQPGEMGYGLRY